MDERTVDVIVQWYQAGSDGARQRELAVCLYRNLTHPLVARVHLLDEVGQGAEAVLSQLPAAVPQEKVHYTPYAGRLSYTDAVRYANERCAGRICVLLNADIFLDDSLQYLWVQSADHPRSPLVRHRPLHMYAYALQRWEDPKAVEGMDSTPTLDRPNDYSQDTWIFKAPLAVVPPETPAVHLGDPACDQYFAWQLRRAGLLVSNPCYTIRTRHVHRDAFRAWYSRPRVSPPYLLVQPEGAERPGLHNYHQGLKDALEQRGVAKTSQRGRKRGQLGGHADEDAQFDSGPRFSVVVLITAAYGKALPTVFRGLEPFLQQGGEVVVVVANGLPVEEDALFLRPLTEVYPGIRIECVPGPPPTCLHPDQGQALQRAMPHPEWVDWEGLQVHSGGPSLGALRNGVVREMARREWVFLLTGGDTVFLDPQAIDLHILAEDHEVQRQHHDDGTVTTNIRPRAFLPTVWSFDRVAIPKQGEHAVVANAVLYNRDLVEWDERVGVRVLQARHPAVDPRPRNGTLDAVGETQGNAALGPVQPTPGVACCLDLHARLAYAQPMVALYRTPDHVIHTLLKPNGEVHHTTSPSALSMLAGDYARLPGCYARMALALWTCCLASNAEQHPMVHGTAMQEVLSLSVRLGAWDVLERLLASAPAQGRAPTEQMLDALLQVKQTRDLPPRLHDVLRAYAGIVQPLAAGAPQISQRLDALRL